MARTDQRRARTVAACVALASIAASLPAAASAAPQTVFAQSFDTTPPPGLPAGFATTGPTAAETWATSTDAATSGPNSAHVAQPAGIPGAYNLTSRTFSLAGCTTDATLTFSHRYAFAATASGGILRQSVNGGPFLQLAEPGLGYSGLLELTTHSTYGAVSAWTGTNSAAPGFNDVSVTLPAAATGNDVALQWSMGTDREGPADTGWFLDDVQVTCGGATPVRLSETFDGVAAPALPDGWTHSNQRAPRFESSAANPDSSPNAAQAQELPYAYDQSMTTPAVPLTGCGNASAPRLSFDHQLALELPGANGAVLELSVDGGPFADVVAAGGGFVAGGYDDTVLALSQGNPLEGRDAWTATTGFDPVVVDLPAGTIGHTVALRWRLGTVDDFASGDGLWAVDDIELECDGVPAISVAPGARAFGDQVVGSQSAATTFTVTNTGTDTLNVGAVSLTGADAGEFTITASDCDGEAVGPNATCDVGVRFGPTSVGPKAAVLSVPSDAPGSPAQVALSGRGTALVTDAGAPAGGGTAGAGGGAGTAGTGDQSVLPTPGGPTVLSLGARRVLVLRKGTLPVSCGVDRASIRSCTVELLSGSRGVGAATARASAPGSRRLRLRIRLNARGRALLADAPGGLALRLRARARSFNSTATLTANRSVRVLADRFVLTSPFGNFPTNGRELDERSRRFFAAAARQAEGARQVVCEGHADGSASADHARRLALERAEVVCALLRDRGVSATLRTVSFGDRRPRATNRTAQGRALNRRVELTIVR